MAKRITSKLTWLSENKDLQKINLIKFDKGKMICKSG